MRRPTGCGNHSCIVNPPKKGEQGTSAGCMCDKVRRAEYIQYLTEENRQLKIQLTRRPL